MPGPSPASGDFLSCSLEVTGRAGKVGAPFSHNALGPRAVSQHLTEAMAFRGGVAAAAAASAFGRGTSSLELWGLSFCIAHREHGAYFLEHSLV